MAAALRGFVMVLVVLCSSSFKWPAEGIPDAEYIKLPLLRKQPFPTPQQALIADSQRAASLGAPVVSGASGGIGQYLVDISIGSPPQRLLLIADTSSDLVWVRCSACRNCSHRQPGSAFFARHSTTFSPFHCYDPACGWAPAPPSPQPCNLTRLHSPCRYYYTYIDESSTSGFFSHDAATLNDTSGRRVMFQRLRFGCAFRVEGSSLIDARGVLGLGRGHISFASQIGKLFGNMFSYCLFDYNIFPPPTSYLFIGGGRYNQSVRISYTPLITNPLSPTFYYIGIRAVTVDGVRLKIETSVWNIDRAGNGGTIIDSGTTLSFLPEPAYRRIVQSFRRRRGLPTLAGPDPRFDYCVNVSAAVAVTARLPRLAFRLVGGAVFAPPWRNYFVDAAEGVSCLALQPVNRPNGFSVIGNLMQQGFLLVFDRDRSRLGFSRTGCHFS